MPGLFGGDQSTQNLLQQQALALGGYGTIPQIQRSQYLADALKSISENGGQNIKSAGALGSNLLAEAILAFSQRNANKQLIASLQQGAGNQQGFFTNGPGASIFGAGAVGIGLAGFTTSRWRTQSS